jgi:hypothetical protein
LFSQTNNTRQDQTPIQPKLNVLADKITSSIFANQPQNTVRTPIVQPPSGIAMPGNTSIGRPSSNTSPTPSLKTLSDGLSAPIESLPWYMQAGRAATDVILNQVKDQTRSFTELSNSLAGLNPDGSRSTLTPAQQNLDRTAKAADVGLSFINSALLPVTAIFTGAEKLPVIGKGAEVVNKLFGKIGEAGSAMFSDILYGTARDGFISKETADIVNPIGEKAFALIAQVVAGKVAHDVAKPKLNEYTNLIHDKILNDPGIKKQLEVKSTSGENVIKQSSSAIKPVEQVKVSDIKVADSVRSWINRETPLPKEVIKSFEETRPGVNELPFNKNGEITLYRDKTPQAGKIESYSLERRAGQEPFVVSRDQVIANIGSKNIAEVFQKAYPKEDIQSVANKEMLQKYSKLESEVLAISGKLDKAVDGTKIAKSAGDVNTTLADNGFKALPMEEQAKYTSTTKAEQVQAVSDILSRDITGAREMIRGEKQIPNGVLPQVLFNAMEAHAIKTGDAALLRDLAGSPIASRLSEAAQALGSHGYNDNPNSPVTAVREIVKAREKAVTKRVSNVSKAKKDIAKEIDSELKKSTSKKQDWASFIRSIQC